MAEEIVDQHLKGPYVTILDLPSLPLWKIFSYLRPPDIRNCALTCQAFLSISNNPLLWKSLYPTQWAYGCWTNSLIHADDLTCYRRSNCPIFDANRKFQVDHESTIKSKWDLFEQHLLTKMLEYLVPRVGTTVRELYFNGSAVLTDHLLNVALMHCPNLVTLNVSETRITSQAFLGLLNHDACRQLQVLDLSHCAMIQDATMTRLASCWRDEKDTPNATSSVENIITVMDVRCQLIAEDELQSKCNKLSAPVDLVTVLHEPIRTIQLPRVEIGKKSKVSGLSSLNVSGCCLLTDETLFMLMTVEPVIENLSFLDLSGCYNLTGGAISAFVKVCPKLKPENLYYCDHILLGPYQFQANGCSNLQKNGCCIVPEF